MFPFVQRLRMNNLYPSTGIGPPDMNASSLDTNSMFNFINQRDEANRNFQLQMLDRQNNLASIAKAAADPQFNTAGKQNPNVQPNVVMGKDAQNPDPFGSAEHAFGSDFELSPKDRAANKLKEEQIKQQGLIAQNKLDSTNTIAAGKSGIAQQRADVYKFKAEHPGMVFKPTKGGNWAAFDPISGDAMDTGIDTGTMSEEDLHNLIGDQRLDQINATGEQNQETQDLKNSGNLAGIAANIKGKQDLNAARAPRVLLPQQQTQDTFNRATQLVNEHPELKPYIHFNSDRSVSVDDPSTGGIFGNSGYTKDTFNSINKVLYPNSSGYQSPTGSTNNAPTAPKGWKYVPKLGGGWTAVEDKGGEE